jgi:hypothetical protein
MTRETTPPEPMPQSADLLTGVPTTSGLPHHNVTEAVPTD